MGPVLRHDQRMKEREAIPKGEIFPKQSTASGGIRSERTKILHGSGARRTGQQQRPQGHMRIRERDLQSDRKAAAVLLQPRKARTAGGSGAKQDILSGKRLIHKAHLL